MKEVILFSFLFLLIGISGLNTIWSQDTKTEANFKAHKIIPGYGFKKMKNPELFQGNKKRKRYFEGWYFKMVSHDQASILSVIPGISLSQNGEMQHAFIQVIDGKTAETFYYDYPIEKFSFSKQKFAIRIGKNYFSKDSLILNIQQDSSLIVGKVYMSGQVNLFKKKNKKTAIMGWYRFVPFMECYHGVVSLTHDLHGQIKKGNDILSFNKGLGYIEKDWGKSMPSAWIWIQSNNFNAKKTSFMLSVANVPWLGSSFTGFLGFFLHNNSVQRFGTYTHARLKLDTSTNDTIKITISDKKFTYRIQAFRNQSGTLKAPLQGSMDRRISESIDANLKLTVLDKKGIQIFQDSTSIAGLETVGDLNVLSRIK